MNQISIYQTNATRQIIESFESCVRWVVLLAQPQSGKSDTFYFVAAEYLRMKKIQKVIIFSGNTERELGDQVRKNMHPFLEKYDVYLEKELGMNPNERCELNGLIRNRIRVYWGADIGRMFMQKDTLFIWEESHSAQDKGMRVDKMLRNIGISANGDIEKLGSNNNYFLSVSATPFSEISDIVHEEPDQFKRVIKLQVDDGYYGVENMLNSDKICGYKMWKECLRNALRHRHDHTPQYAIVRVRNDTMGDEVKRMAERAGYAVAFYNSQRKDIPNMDALSVAPQKNTMVIIKGMCRMGKVVPKMHISFCMETSNSSNTDTILQGLLGRMFGWHSYRNIVVYVNDKILKSGELEKYVLFMKGEHILPRKGANLMVGGGGGGGGGIRNHCNLYPIVPIRICRNDLIVDGSEDIIDVKYSREAIILSIKSAFADGRITQNLNDEAQQTEVRNQILNFDETQFEVRNTNYETYRNVGKRIAECIHTKTPSTLGSSCGIQATGQEIKIYYFPESELENGISAGDLFIDARTHAVNEHFKHKQELIEKIPLTTRKEVFSTRQESGTEVMGNGAYSIPFPVNSCVDVQEMLNGVRDIVRLSLEFQSDTLGALPRHIHSNQTEDAKWKGILCDDSVYKSLKKEGEVYKKIKEEFNVELKTKKASGRLPTELKENGFIRLMVISW